ncbi:uncharacterized protein Z519_06718 [Cladophialophora bantiana CBS 173.52]|uniref:Uncharacterized protein n=1 Tax=Cladophialophora bantiana (strain ATCC 10958 / CBS 173.52 / CDC B-1940 / NIH 8579) TaxID=1442370 RepID=A0A0D2I7S4_CLAB1|nr:uncharacterized protein Z519_06718 [Cladophialophora bantiana CBS 173.52]KIW92869.1 hypothetical protein Z519_06718 [Cladophialophora bantiana CBS 173.52]
MAAFQPSNNTATTSFVAVSFDETHAMETSERPISPPVPTTEGRNQRRRIPVFEIDENGIEDILVPVVLAIGRIEDLIQYPTQPSSSPSPPTPIIRPVADHSATTIPNFDLDRAFPPAPVNELNIHTEGDVLWRTFASATSSGGAPLERSRLVIPVVADEEYIPRAWPQPRRHAGRQPRSELARHLESFPASDIQISVMTVENAMETEPKRQGTVTSIPSRREEEIEDWADSLTEHVARVRFWANRNGLH